MFKTLWNMIFKISDDDIDNEIDEYLKARHHLKGNDLNLEIDKNKPETEFEILEPKAKKKIEVIEIEEHVRRNKKSGKQLF